MRNGMLGVALLVVLGLFGCDDESRPSSPGVPESQKTGLVTTERQADQTGDGMLPAGTYSGSVLGATTTMQMQYVYSPITGGGMQMRPVVTPMLMPSPVGNLILDGRGNYSLSGIKDAPENPSGGTYALDPKTPAVVFTSGPLKPFKTKLTFSDTGTAMLNARAMVPVKDPKPGEVMESEVSIDFSGTTANPKLVNRAAARPQAGVAVAQEPIPPRVAPPEWNGYSGTLLLSGNTTMQIHLTDGTVDTSLTNVYTDAYGSSGDGLMLLTIYRGTDILLQVIDAKCAEQGAPINVQKTDSIAPQDPFAAISPDGKLIAYYVNFSSMRKNEFLMDIFSEVRVCDRAGTIVATHKGFTQPTWTPDGKLVLTGAMALPGGEYLPGAQTGIFITDSVNDKPKQVVPGLEPPAKPSISPDGKRIAFIESRALWTCNIDGTSRKKVLTIPNGGYLHDAAWSPDGRGLAVCHDVNSIQSQVDILDLESDKLLRVFDPKNRVSVVGRKIAWLATK